jgi:hypothetical protein
MRKAARRAGRAAPAVAVVGALAAAPPVQHLASSALDGVLGRSAPARPVSGPLAAARRTAVQARTGRPPLVSDRVLAASGVRPAWFKTNTYRPAPSPSVPSPSPSPSQSASASPQHSAPAEAASTAPPSPSPAPSTTTPAAGTVQCRDSASGPLPENYAAIVGYLTEHGYTGLAAAGVAGNIYQESKGDPESVGSGGGGLIGWTPLPSGFVTGDVAADLDTQLGALLTYNEQWAQYLPALNAATTAADAAYIYMSDFERPGIPATENREAAATAVAEACGLLGERPAIVTLAVSSRLFRSSPDCLVSAASGAGW